MQKLKIVHTKFWIVWSPEGKTPPRKFYDNLARAEHDAKEVVSAHPEQVAYVLEFVSGAMGKQCIAASKEIGVLPIVSG